jgi:hypothetical protein
MEFDSSNDFVALRRLVFRIDLAPPGTDAHLSEKELARSLSENYPFYKMKVKGDTATFSGLDGDGEPASFDFIGARGYRHNFGALVDQGGPVVVQLGLRTAGESDPPHLRVIIDEWATNSRYSLVWLMQDLAVFCGESGPFDESRITLEEIEADFFLDQWTIEEVEPAHQSASAGALDTMIDAEGRVCGYQLGEHLDPRAQAEMPCTAATRQVEGIAFWEQTREFALHSGDFFREGRSGLLLVVKLHGAFGLKTLGEKNPLAGFELEYRSTCGTEQRSRVFARHWNIWEFWARIVFKASAVGSRD